MQTLTVGFITPGFATPEDAGLPAITDLVTHVALEHDVRVVSLRHPSITEPYQLGGATVHPLAAGREGGAIGRGRLLVRAVRRIRQLHAERPFHVLHGLWADEAGAAAVVAGRLIGRPTVVSVLGGEVMALSDIGYGTALGRGGRWTVSIALRGADVVTAGSSTVRDLLERSVPSERIASLPLGVDLTVFSPKPAETAPGPATILHVGSLEPVKDQVTLLRAFARLVTTHPAARLVICGSGSLRQRLEHLAVRLGIDDAVDLQGHVPRAELPDLYRSASMLVVSSRWDAQSMVAVEAAACGSPVVGTKVGCLPDLGEGARTVPVGDHVALAEQMAALLTDPGVRERAGGAARSRAGARYDLDTVTADLVAMYLSVCDRHGVIA